MYSSNARQRDRAARARARSARATTACVRILRLVLDDPVQLLVVPAAAGGDGRVRRSPPAASCSAPSTSSGRSSWTPTCRAGRPSSCCSRCSTAFIIALLSMLGEYVVRTLNAVSALDTYHVSDAGRPRDAAPARHRRAAVRHHLPARPCSTPTREIAMARPRRPEPKVFLLRRARRPRAATGTDATYFAHAARRAASWARRAPATSRTRRPPRGPRPMLGDPQVVVLLRDPVAAGGLELAVQHRRTASRPAASTTALRDNLEGPPPLGPRAHVGLAVRLPRARSLRRLPRALARRASRRRRTCSSSRSC